MPTPTITDPIHKATSEEVARADNSHVAQEQIETLRTSIAAGDNALPSRIHAKRVLVRAPKKVAVRAVPVD